MISSSMKGAATGGMLSCLVFSACSHFSFLFLLKRTRRESFFFCDTGGVVISFRLLVEDIAYDWLLLCGVLMYY